jgi:hypothetical protein
MNFGPMHQSPIAAICARGSNLAQSKEKQNQMNAKGLLVLAAAFGLAGCATSAVQPQGSCELMAAQICSKAAEAQLSEGALAVSYTPRPDDAQVVPFVVPVFRTDGVLAAEVDCYAKTDSHTYSMVRSETAIAPSSDESVEFLRGRHLCADDGAYAGGAAPGAGLLADGGR